VHGAHVTLSEKSSADVERARASCDQFLVKLIAEQRRSLLQKSRQFSLLLSLGLFIYKTEQ